MRGPDHKVVGMARRLRGQMTDAEARLWYFLRDRRFVSFKFVRQAPIGPYVVDSLCRQAKLVIELDGGQHAESARDVLGTLSPRARRGESAYAAGPHAISASVE